MRGEGEEEEEEEQEGEHVGRGELESPSEPQGDFISSTSEEINPSESNQDLKQHTNSNSN